MVCVTSLEAAVSNKQRGQTQDFAFLGGVVCSCNLELTCAHNIGNDDAAAAASLFYWRRKQVGMVSKPLKFSPSPSYPGSVQNRNYTELLPVWVVRACSQNLHIRTAVLS